LKYEDAGMSKLRAFSRIVSLAVLLLGATLPGPRDASRVPAMQAQLPAFETGSSCPLLHDRLLFAGEECSEENTEEQDETSGSGRLLPLWLELNLQCSCRGLAGRRHLPPWAERLYLLHCDFRC
jgi:hypothetical protein